MYNYDNLLPQTDPHSTVCLWSNSRTQTRPQLTIAPHWSSSYPEYLSPSWDEDIQRPVVWARLREHRKLANRSLSKINERYKALHQEQQTQVESRHEPSSHDISPIDYQLTFQNNGRYTTCFTLTSYPLIERQSSTVLTITHHHLTSWKGKNNMKWSKSWMSISMGTGRSSNIW